MLEWLRDFAREYALWTFLDWVRDTLQGKAMALSLGAAGVSALARTVGGIRGWESSTKHTLNVALLTSGFIVLGVGCWTLLASPSSRLMGAFLLIAAIAFGLGFASSTFASAR